jgi:hypothetical protein
MNSNEIESYPPSGVCAEVKLRTAKEVLGQEARRIEVSENAELLLSPAIPEFAGSFSRVQLQSYADMQLLGFAPRKLAEEKIRHAIAADDDEVYKLASTMPQLFTRCDCGDQAAYAKRSPGISLRTAYNSIRKNHNPTLAALLSDHLGTRIDWDSPIAGITRKWISYLRFSPEVIIGLFEDITINRNATLAVAASAKSLMAYNIWIHRTGRLVQQGSYLKIWANSVNSFRDFREMVAVEVARKNGPPWLKTE